MSELAFQEAVEEQDAAATSTSTVTWERGRDSLSPWRAAAAKAGGGSHLQLGFVAGRPTPEPEHHDVDDGGGGGHSREATEISAPWASHRAFLERRRRDGVGGPPLVRASGHDFHKNPRKRSMFQHLSPPLRPTFPLCLSFYHQVCGAHSDDWLWLVSRFQQMTPLLLTLDMVCRSSTHTMQLKYSIYILYWMRVWSMIGTSSNGCMFLTCERSRCSRRIVKHNMWFPCIISFALLMLSTRHHKTTSNICHYKLTPPLAFDHAEAFTSVVLPLRLNTIRCFASDLARHVDSNDAWSPQQSKSQMFSLHVRALSKSYFSMI